MDKVLYIYYDNGIKLLKEKLNRDNLLDLNLLYDNEKSNLISGHEVKTLYDKICKIITDRNIDNVFVDYNLGSVNPFAVVGHIRLSDQIKDIFIFIVSEPPVLLKEHKKQDFNLPKLNAVILETAETLLKKDSFGYPKYRELSNKFKL